MELLDGKAASDKILEKISKEIENLSTSPTLAVILVGDNPASKVYVGNKKRCCERIGIRSLEYHLPENTGQFALLRLVEELNTRQDVHGILCQFPLPKGYDYDEDAVADAISEKKDVDAFHFTNVGKMFLGKSLFLPCTPAGIIQLLKHYEISLTGAHVVILGRSNLVGKPMAFLALQEDATVTICHSKTQNLSKITHQADILIVAIGKPRFVTAEMVKPQAVVVDVGMNRLPDGKFCGDVDFDAVSRTTRFITPVPGGVGPMTITVLMQNTLAAATQPA